MEMFLYVVLFLFTLVRAEEEASFFSSKRYVVESNSTTSASPSKKDPKYEKAKVKLKKMWKEKEKEEQQKRKLASEEEPKEAKENKIEEYLLGVKSGDIKKVKEKIPKKDIRQNILEVFVAPGLLYVDSDSEYFYRNLRSYSQSLNLGAKIWFSPYMGFKAEYLTSMGATAKDDLDGGNTSIISHEWFKFSLLKRIFLKEKSDYLQFSFDYKSYNLKSPADSETLGNIENSFWGFGFSHHSNANEGLSKELGVKLFVFGQEDERGASVDFSSGSLDKSYSISIHRGWKYRINRKHAFFTNIIYQFDKQIYKGEVSPTDPKTGEDLEGVDVNSDYLIFELGYEWGS